MIATDRIFSPIMGRDGGDEPSPTVKLAQFDKELDNLETLVRPAPVSNLRTRSKQRRFN